MSHLDNYEVYNLVLDGVTLTLDVDNFQSPFRDGDVHPSPNGLFYLPTDNIDADLEYLKSLGVEITEIERFHKVDLFYFYDFDRNKIMIYQQ